MEFFESSALNNTNVNIVFETLARMIERNENLKLPGELINSNSNSTTDGPLSVPILRSIESGERRRVSTTSSINRLPRNSARNSSSMAVTDSEAPMAFDASEFIDSRPQSTSMPMDLAKPEKITESVLDAVLGADLTSDDDCKVIPSECECVESLVEQNVIVVSDSSSSVSVSGIVLGDDANQCLTISFVESIENQTQMISEQNQSQSIEGQIEDISESNEQSMNEIVKPIAVRPITPEKQMTRKWSTIIEIDLPTEDSKPRRPRQHRFSSKISATLLASDSEVDDCASSDSDD
jgi:hypothetical protein